MAMLDVTAGLTDEELYDHAKSVGGESFPIELADRLLAGENAVRVYRDHRGMTQNQLAGAAGINPLYLSQIERGVRTGSARTLAALAEPLGVDVDDLIHMEIYQEKGTVTSSLLYNLAIPSFA